MAKYAKWLLTLNGRDGVHVIDLPCILSLGD
jgi:hypothetical protein